LAPGIFLPQLPPGKDSTGQDPWTPWQTRLLGPAMVTGKRNTAWDAVEHQQKMSFAALRLHKFLQT
jgi:hypothetical protein